MTLAPNQDDMRGHLSELFSWMIEADPTVRFELRALHPDRNYPRRERFTVNNIDGAVAWAAKINATHNVYVIPNPIRPGTPDITCDGKTHFASDMDILFAHVHFVEYDRVDYDRLTQHQDRFPFAFYVVTGTIPYNRLHAYHRLDTITTDLRAWQGVQRGLVQAYGSDPAVINASRLMRLAGSVSRPNQDKVERGYKTELTQFIRPDNENGNNAPIEVDRDAYYQTFAYTPPEPKVYKVEPFPDYFMDNSVGKIPIAVVGALLRAIPPITHDGDYLLWIRICRAVIDANPSARVQWETWQRQGRYQKGDDRLWDNLIAKGDTTEGTYKLLFKLATEADPEWYADGHVVEAWWMEDRERFMTELKERDQNNAIKNGLKILRRRK